MSTDTGRTARKRGYDARSRQHRAERERADTLDRVLAAARSRFLSEGYAGTKMLDIAAEAGVALASVYRAGRSKAELIELIVERTNAGGDPEGSPGEPPTFAALAPKIAAEPDPLQQVQMMAVRIADSLDRIGPLWTVLRDAAGVDDRAAATLQTTVERRAAAFEAAVALLPAQRLRATPSESVDTLWALSTPEMYLMLRTNRGWSRRRYRDWLIRTLQVQLLIPTNDPPE